MKPPAPYQNRLGMGNQCARALWGLVGACLFRPTPRLPGFWAWRRLILRLFGAKLGRGVKVYASARIWAPWNLEIGDHGVIGPWTDIYSVDRVVLGPGAWVSQYAFLCTAGHDVTDPARALTTAPIRIGANAWVAAGVFVGPGVTVGEGAVLAARACVVRDVKAGQVVGGNPARLLKRRRLR
jgi:putative colanic acid biosynthesis acetyltransferase WcaF